MSSPTFGAAIGAAAGQGRCDPPEGKMRAAVFIGPSEALSIEYVPEPVPGVGEVVIKVHRCGICGSDVHSVSGHGMTYPPGTILGHEYAGEVVALGTDVTNLTLGDRITAMPVGGCQQCAHCKQGFPILCTQMKGYSGGFAEYAVANARTALRLPRSLTMADGALIEPLAVALHGAAIGSIGPHARVLVVGMGPVGLGAIFWARQLGAGRIVTIARSNVRSGLARKFGADAALTVSKNSQEEIYEELGGPPDIVLECVGVPGMLARCIEWVAPNGVIVSMGFCSQADSFAPFSANLKQVRMIFAMAYTLAEFEHVARVLDKGTIDLERLITDTVSLDQLPIMIKGLAEHSAHAKVQVAP